MTEALPRLPAEITTLCTQFQSGLMSALNDRFASLYVYGALAFPRPARWRVDIDFHVLVTQPLSDNERQAVKNLHDRLGEASSLGEALDGYYILLEDARQSDPPMNQAWIQVVDEAWALHRAHILAGRLFLLHGLDPRKIVPAPSWSELETALDHEMDFIERHPEERAFALLNACRVLYSFQTRDVVTSKFASSQWALESLPRERTDLIEAAVRLYLGAGTDTDERLLDEGALAFVAYIKGEIDRVR